MTLTFFDALLSAKSESISITMNETIPVLLVAGFVSSALILYFIAFVVLSLGTRKTKTAKSGR